MAPETLLLNRCVILQSAEETVQLGAWVASTLTKPTILFLYGDLGSAKTTFSKGFINYLTSEPLANITSPTFVYMNLYESSTYPIAHFDLYRLKSQKEFLSLGFDEILNSNNHCLIEWPEIIEDLPISAIKLKFSTYQNYRKVELIGGTFE